MTKKVSIACLLLLGVCFAAYLPSVFAADREAKQHEDRNAKSETPQLKMSCQITMTDATGKSEIVASPSVIAFEGQAAVVEITQPNGESIKIQLVGRMLPAQATKLTDSPANSDSRRSKQNL